MGKKVFANNMEIAHQAGDAKVMAAFPDVCLSPPPPPTGPVPVPYPNTSFAKDLKEGSSTVKIGGKPLALKGQSYYATSPLGNEAATRNFGGAVITHTITGKTYFQAFSMNVKVEGKNVCRHLDITTSNHASYPGSTPPMPNAEAQNLAIERIEQDKCPCCGKAKHAEGQPMNRDEWYEANLRQRHQQRMAELEAKLAQDAAKAEAAAVLHPKHGRAAASALAATAAQQAQLSKQMNTDRAALRNLMHRAKTRPGCTCGKPPPPLLPSPPCDVFYSRPPPGPARDAQQAKVEEDWNNYRKKHVRAVGRTTTPAPLKGVKPGEQVNHLTPKSAGGCPTGDGNLQPHAALCGPCQAIDAEFNPFQ